MGRTILSATQTWVEEEKALKRFVRALRKSDQDLAQELLALSRQHIAEASYASNLYPMDIYLVSMLLEMYKKIKRMERQLGELGVENCESVTETDIPNLPSLLDLVTPATKRMSKKTNEADASGVEYIDFQDSG